MPTLNWIGKKAVENHHMQVPFRLLKDVPELACGDPGSGNLIVQGDNLEALKALLPYYAGQVKCIYIDPPYNTGNEGWAYNDNVNSPEIRRWLGQVVGKEGETLDRHDRWLCMMYPRLALLRQFLCEEGVILVSIGTDELAHLVLLMDEIFGTQNRIAIAAWETSYTANQTAKHISETTDFVLVYAKRFGCAIIGKWNRTTDQLAKFKNPDNDQRGPWKSENLSSGKYYSLGQFEITGPTGRKFLPPPGRYWRCNEKQFNTWLSDDRITFGLGGTGRPMLKRYRDELTQGLTPTTWWKHEEFATAKEASIELKAILDGQAAFATPKPTLLIQRILQITTDKHSLILDSFSGSGTTGHAVLKQNAEDGGNRRFILVEMDAEIARGVTAERVRRVVKGYTKADDKKVEGLGGGFRYCELGESLFDETGKIRDSVRFADLARHVYFTATGEPLPRERVGKSPLLGVTSTGVAVYLLYNGILKDRTPAGGNVLTSATLDLLPPHSGPKIVYAAACRLSEARRAREQIEFRQTPYAIKTT